MAAREATKEREENARKRKKTKNSTMYTIPIMDYKDLRNKFVYIKAKTSNDDCFWTQEQELIMSQIYEILKWRSWARRHISMECYG
jgi:hypothetical protein